ncbi:MAG: hypothetical protein ACMXYG_04490 [Candidatus Woesearchaeota archaeon]
MTTVAGFPGDKEHLFNEDHQSGSTHQQIERTLEEQVGSTKIDEAHIAEQKLQEFMSRFNDEKNRGILNKAESLKDQLNRVEQLNMVLLTAPDTSKMTEDEKQRYDKRLDRKIKVYDTLQKIGINPYRIEVRRHIRMAKRERDRLQTNLDSFLMDLKGVSTRKSNNEFYSKILKDLPEHIREDAQYSGLMDYLKTRSGSSANGNGGLKGQLRDLKQQASYFADIDDILEDTIAKYNVKISEINSEVHDLTKQISENPSDQTLLQERTKKTALKMVYESERDNYLDTREEVFDKLSEIRWDFNYVGEQVSLLDAMTVSTRKSLRTLNNGIQRFEKSIQGKEKTLVYGEHLEMARLAMSKGERLLIGSDYNMQHVYEKMKDIEIQQTYDPNSSRVMSGGKFGEIVNEIRAKEAEEMASFKAAIRNKL